ncbi:DUF1636 family protein [Roseibium sediminicola]|uniref:DUF1636 domain-containing protein n=1 Tax=Roseibium sediminicola TaxID=2933272 RepID=A0ABT0H0R5_9HYPH|nr:DUF1636 family protein [Roseibium sp. CAU 1639]MCK7615269.1 DUF1636 domain-containing protein [Roseibium sp. CAU 1639]
MSRLLLCRTCQHEAGSTADNALSALKQAFENVGLDRDLDLGTVDCMGACEQPVSLAFQGQDRATFVFSGLRFPDDIDDIVATARTYLGAKDGWIEDARSCGRLRFCLRARIPAMKPDDAV